jgi:hypothetical protein
LVLRDGSLRFLSWIQAKISSLTTRLRQRQAGEIGEPLQDGVQPADGSAPAHWVELLSRSAGRLHWIHFKAPTRVGSETQEDRRSEPVAFPPALRETRDSPDRKSQAAASGRREPAAPAEVFHPAEQPLNNGASTSSSKLVGPVQPSEMRWPGTTTEMDVPPENPSLSQPATPAWIPQFAAKADRFPGEHVTGISPEPLREEVCAPLGNRDQIRDAGQVFAEFDRRWPELLPIPEAPPVLDWPEIERNLERRNRIDREQQGIGWNG